MFAEPFGNSQISLLTYNPPITNQLGQFVFDGVIRDGPGYSGWGRGDIGVIRDRSVLIRCDTVFGSE